MEWIRFAVGAVFLLIGISIFAIELIGVYKLNYVLDRMHAAAMGDTLGISASLIGLMIMNGVNFLTLKIFLVVLFLWISSPVSAHLLSLLEVTTNEDKESHYDSDENESAGRHEE